MKHEFVNGVSVFRNGPKTVEIDWKAETISTTRGGKTSTSTISKDLTIQELLKGLGQ